MKNETLANLLLEWFDRQGRDLPWRVRGMAHPNPYVILVSEIMLQQTTVKTVVPYFYRFMKRFPTIQSLAEASQEEVYFYWQGLGYYSRARSLHATAKMIVEKYNGIFPQDKKEVLKLKGIGPYTAASFLSLAFNQPEAVVDGNVVRIICRFYGLVEPAQDIMETIRNKADEIASVEHPADYTSAIMDLGATVCTPKNPKCLECPWQENCFARINQQIENIPVLKKLEKKNKTAQVFLITNSKNEIFIRKREGKGLLSGLYEFPWEEDDSLNFDSKDTTLEVSHVFTHFKLVLKIQILSAEEIDLKGQFVPQETLQNYPFSTLMKKVYKKYLNAN